MSATLLSPTSERRPFYLAIVAGLACAFVIGKALPTTMNAVSAIIEPLCANSVTGSQDVVEPIANRIRTALGAIGINITLNPISSAEYADRALSKYDMPEWFLSVTEFPLTASGKILKRELVDMVKRGVLRPEPVRFGTDKV